LSCILC